MRLDTVNLKKGDTLVVTIKSDENDKNVLKSIKKQMKKAFPSNKIAVFGIGKDDDISIGVLNKGSKNGN